jgi:Na+/H+ antiporter NhaD/arsenite permease-like protein
MLLTAIIAVFVLGYLAIALEHPLRINKAASALILGTMLWLLWFSASNSMHGAEGLHKASEQLFENIGDLSQILLFLMGAMTIVAIIDANDGFSIITSKIKTTNVRALIWIISGITFALSPVIDNLTATIVMVTLVRRMIFERKIRLYFTGLIIIAANSGGAWSPIGDVTTTMLWMGGQVSAPILIQSLILPSIISLFLPAIVMSFMLKGNITKVDQVVKITEADAAAKPPVFERNLIFMLGIGSLISVPLIKTLFHVPPYIAILLALGIFWAAVEFLGSRYKRHSVPKRLVVFHIAKGIDVPNVLFFAGILLAIGVLGVSGQLNAFAAVLENTFGDIRMVMFAIGFISAFVDNVPLVAATMGMYSLEAYPMDHLIWEFIAFNCGTGGSMLVIGSAAGIAAMGMDRNLTFGWYLKKITPLAVLSYCAGAGYYLLLRGAL